MNDALLIGTAGLALMWGGVLLAFFVSLYRFNRARDDTYDPPEWATPVLIRHDDFTVDLEWREWLPGSPEMTE